MKYIKNFENYNDVLYRIGDIVRLKEPIPSNMVDTDQPIPKMNTNYIVKRIYRYNTNNFKNLDIDDIYIDFNEVNRYNNNTNTLVNVVDANTNELIEGYWSTRYYSVLKQDINKYNL